MGRVGEGGLEQRRGEERGGEGRGSVFWEEGNGAKIKQQETEKESGRGSGRDRSCADMAGVQALYKVVDRLVVIKT